jgi:hypothetical protein
VQRAALLYSNLPHSLGLANCFPGPTEESAGIGGKIGVMKRSSVLGWASILLCLSMRPVQPEVGSVVVQGMTISCQGWGREWASDQFCVELDELKALGVNWVAIHPYAWVGRDGGLSWPDLDPANPPEWLARPIRETRARGMSLFIKPHLGYWGSPFSWRGEIDYPDVADRRQFFDDYKRWIVQIAACTKDADAFAVGTELELLNTERDDAQWRDIISEIRKVTDVHLTYAANWDVFRRLSFWDALDVVGVQAYFPIASEVEPTDLALQEGWQKVISELRAVHDETGLPIVMTELGYNCSLDAAREPWAHKSAKGADRGPAALLQQRLLRTGLLALKPETEWLRGAFLWKWFPGEARRANFMMDEPILRGVIANVWAAGTGRPSETKSE